MEDLKVELVINTEDENDILHFLHWKWNTDPTQRDREEECSKDFKSRPMSQQVIQLCFTPPSPNLYIQTSLYKEPLTLSLSQCGPHIHVSNYFMTFEFNKHTLSVFMVKLVILKNYT